MIVITNFCWLIKNTFVKKTADSKPLSKVDFSKYVDSEKKEALKSFKIKSSNYDDELLQQPLENLDQKLQSINDSLISENMDKLVSYRYKSEYDYNRVPITSCFRTGWIVHSRINKIFDPVNRLRNVNGSIPNQDCFFQEKTFRIAKTCLRFSIYL